MACGGGREEDPSDFVGKTVVQHAVFEAERDVIEGLVKIYEEDNPDIKILLVSLNDILGLGSGDISNSATSEQLIQIAESADVYPSFFLYGLNQQKLTADLAPFIESDNDFDPDDFYADVIEKSRINGEIRVLPTTLQFSWIYYDKKLFDEAGVAYPEPGWSWDDFLATARALTIRDGGEVTQWGFVDPYNDIGLFVGGQLDAPMVDWSTDPPTLRSQDADIVAALERYIVLRNNTDIIPKFDSANSNEGASLIERGKAAMWINLVFNDNTDRAAIPVHEPGDSAGWMALEGYSMSAGTQNPQAAWDWMAFLSRQFLNYDPGVIALPARQSVAEASDYWNNLERTTPEMLRFALDHAYIDGTLALSDVLYLAAEAVLFEGKAVETALAEAHTTTERLFANDIAEVNAIPEITVINAVPNAASVNPNATEIIFTTGFNEVSRFRPIADQFSEQHPDIVVQFTSSDSDPSFITLAGTTDCFMAGPEIHDPVNRALIVPVDALLDSDDAFPEEDLFPLLHKQFSAEGQLWGIPAFMTPIVIVYNRDLFDASGIAYPQAGWDMDDFLDNAVTLTSGDDGSKVYGFVPNADELFITMAWLERMGVAFLDDSVEPPTVNLKSPDVEAAVRWYANLTESSVKPTFVADATFSADFTEYERRSGLINAGRAAMWTFTGSLFEDDVASDGTANKGFDFPVGVVSLPVGATNGGSNLLPAQGYFIAADTPHRAQCWEWIKFLSAEPSIPDGVPSRQSVANSAEFRQLVGDDYADAYLSSLDGDIGSNSLYRLMVGDKNWLAPSVFWFGRAMQQIYASSHSVEDALEEAQLKINDYRNCIIDRDGVNKPDIRTECLQKIDPSLIGVLE